MVAPDLGTWWDRLMFPPDIAVKTPQYRAEGKLPTMSDLYPSIYIAVILVVVRMLLNIAVWRPAGRRLMGLSAKRPTQLTALDYAYNPKKVTTRQELESVSKSSGYELDYVKDYFRQRRKWDRQSVQLFKFTEASFRFSIYGVVFAYGLYVTYGTPWWQNPWVYCWKDWPFHVEENPVSLLYYYRLGMGMYLAMFVFQFLDTKRSDFWEMFLHHIITLIAMSASWVCVLMRAGAITMVFHDVSDVLLEGAKIFNYIKHRHSWAKILADVVFLLFAVTFFVTRLGLFTYYIFYNGVAHSRPYYPGENYTAIWYFFSITLLSLQLLHIFWSFLILRMIYLFVVKGLDGDIRSDNDIAGSEEEADKQKKAD